MHRKKQKKLKADGSRLKVGIVVSEFHHDITKRMLSGALQTLRAAGVRSQNIKVIRVPGSFEIPLGCELLAKTKKFNALVALGCIIKGETEHHRYIAASVSKGIMDVSLRLLLPIGFGILTTNNLSQAKARSRGQNNKGNEAAEAALQMAALEKPV